MPQLSSDPPPRIHRRARALAIATLGVLAAHWLLLFALGPAWIDPDDTPTTPPRLSVRSVSVPVAVTAAAAPVPPPSPAVAKVARAARPGRLAASAPTTDAPTPDSASASVPAPPVSEPAAPPPAAATGDVAEPPALMAELPVYVTRLPPAGRWRYQLQRGIASGDAELRWAPASDGRYEMHLEGRIAGVTVLDWVSRGEIGAHGIAPERFVIRRRGRDHQAANFQRDAGKVTFSGPTHELPLLPGVQDRLGWLLQLPAVIEAAPERFGPGARVTLMVVGARGGADVWHFAVVGPDRLDDMPALKLLREARRPHDTQVEIWLDPARAHLPLRARLSQPEGGAPLELRLEQVASTGP